MSRRMLFQTGYFVAVDEVLPVVIQLSGFCRTGNDQTTECPIRSFLSTTLSTINGRKTQMYMYVVVELFHQIHREKNFFWFEFSFATNARRNYELGLDEQRTRAERIRSYERVL